MKKAINLKNIYSKQYLLLICIGFLPLCWKVLEIVLLSGFVNGLKILAQISLIQIIFKIFEETLLNPLYKLLGKDNYKTEEDKNTIAKKFLIYYSIATLAFTALVFILLSPILSISQIPEEIFNQTKSFLNIYIISCGLGVISKYLHTFSIINKDTKKNVYLFAFKSTCHCSFVCDFCSTIFNETWCYWNRDFRTCCKHFDYCLFVFNIPKNTIKTYFF